MMSKQSILLHIEGVEAYQQKNYQLAASTFRKIPERTSKIIFNIGCCYLNLRSYGEAEKFLLESTEKDKYNSAGQFQLGVAQCFLGKFSEASKSFNNCLTAMRGNSLIDYKQLNMAARLYAFQVKFNLGLLYLFSGDTLKAGSLFDEAKSLENKDGNTRINQSVASIKSHNFRFFGDSIADRIMTLPESAVFAPSKTQRDGVKGDSSLKMTNSEVAIAADDTYEFVGFVGPEKLKRQLDTSPQLSNKVLSQEIEEKPKLPSPPIFKPPSIRNDAPKVPPKSRFLPPPSQVPYKAPPSLPPKPEGVSPSKPKIPPPPKTSFVPPPPKTKFVPPPPKAKFIPPPPKAKIIPPPPKTKFVPPPPKPNLRLPSVSKPPLPAKTKTYIRSQGSSVPSSTAPPLKSNFSSKEFLNEERKFPLRAPPRPPKLGS